MTRTLYNQYVHASYTSSDLPSDYIDNICRLDINKLIIIRLRYYLRKPMDEALSK